MPVALNERGISNASNRFPAYGRIVLVLRQIALSAHLTGKRDDRICAYLVNLSSTRTLKYSYSNLRLVKEVSGEVLMKPDLVPLPTQDPF